MNRCSTKDPYFSMWRGPYLQSSRWPNPHCREQPGRKTIKMVKTLIIHHFKCLLVQSLINLHSQHQNQQKNDTDQPVQLSRSSVSRVFSTPSVRKMPSPALGTCQSTSASSRNGAPYFHWGYTWHKVAELENKKTEWVPNLFHYWLYFRSL